MFKVFFSCDNNVSDVCTCYGFMKVMKAVGDFPVGLTYIPTENRATFFCDTATCVGLANHVCQMCLTTHSPLFDSNRFIIFCCNSHCNSLNTLQKILRKQ